MPVQIDMDMPIGCHFCPFFKGVFWEKEKARCGMSLKVKAKVGEEKWKRKRPKNCPLQEVK